MVENNDDNVMRNGNKDDNKQEQSASQALAVEEKNEINECQKIKS